MSHSGGPKIIPIPARGSRSDELHITSNVLLGKIHDAISNIAITGGGGAFPPVPAPSAPATGWIIYCDQADNILKAIYANGDIRELALT